MTADARERLAALRSRRTDVFPLSSAQQRLWLSDQALPGLPAYHLVRVLDLDGELDTEALDAALTELVRRHEALRTSVLAVGGQPLQRVAAPAPVELPVLDTTEAAAGELLTATARRPLNLAAGPLWRGELHRFGPCRHRLVLVFHHLVVDAATITMLLGELAAAYRAYRDGQIPDLPPAVPYRGYVVWERSFAADPDWARQFAHWTAELAGCEPLDLPTDRPRPTAPRRPGGLVPVRIPAPIADALRAVAKAHGATLAQLILAGYATVLHRCGGRTDVVIGMPVSTRHDPTWTRGAGLYVTTLPIRVRAAGNPPFAELLRRVRGTVLAALGATDVPLEHVSRSAGPLYDVTFSLVQGPAPALELPGLTTRLTHVYGGRAKFDLHFELTDPGPGRDLTGNLEYDADLFDPESAQRLAAGIGTLLDGVAAGPDQRIGALPLWGEIPATRAEPTLDARIDRLFAETAEDRPDHVALIDAAGGEELTYAGLAARAGRVAEELAGHGVRRGDFVGIALPRSVDLVVAVLGVLAAGAAYVPLDRANPAKRLAGMIDRARIRLVIGEDLPGLDTPVIGLPTGTAALPEATTGDGGDPAYVMFTSGSTGAPTPGRTRPR